MKTLRALSLSLVIAVTFLVLLGILVNGVIGLGYVIYWLSGGSIVYASLFTIGVTWLFVWVYVYDKEE